MSKTIFVGTPPANPDTFPGPWQAHSALSPGKTCASPTSGCGNVRTRWPSPRLTPLTSKVAWPKSAWADPGAHTRSEYASAGDPGAALAPPAWRLTVDSETSAPHSSTSLVQTRCAVWRCLLPSLRSSLSHWSTSGAHSSILLGLRLATGVLGDRSSSRAYL